LTYRIRRSEDPHGTIFDLSGELDSEHAARLEELIGDTPYGTIRFNLGEVTLVARDSVRFLALAESRGTRIVDCPDYVRSWIDAERGMPTRKR